VLVPETDLSWDDVPDSLLALAACELDDGSSPQPRLLAHRGSEPVAIATLRPFAPHTVLDPVIELLALLLPLGTDRVAIALPCRLWPVDTSRPVVAEADGIDLRQRGVVVATADGRGGSCEVTAAVHPFTLDDVGEWGWEPPVGSDGAPEAPLLDALRVLLDRREELATDHSELRPQLERVLLLGHELALAPRAAAELGVAAPAWN
jgi:hypothetical protein